MFVLYFDSAYFRWAPILLKSILLREPQERVYIFGINLEQWQVSCLLQSSNVVHVEEVRIEQPEEVMSFHIIERKAQFLLQVFALFPGESVFMMDVDMLLNRPLAHLKSLLPQYDWAAVRPLETKIAGGFYALRPTELCKSLLQEWDEFLMDGEFYFNKDQPSLARLIAAYSGRLRFLTLPRSYLDHLSQVDSYVWSAHKTEFGSKDERFQYYARKIGEDSSACARPRREQGSSTEESAVG